MKNSTLILILVFFSALSFAQDTLRPQSIEIGNLNEFPLDYWNGPVQIVHNTEQAGLITLKNPLAHKVGSVFSMNNIDNALISGVGGTNREREFERNSVMLLSYTAYSYDNIRYFSIGNTNDKCPIVFLQSSEEVFRIDEEGNIKLKNPNTGVILTSPNGTEYKITVDDYGNLSTSSSIADTKTKISTYDIDLFPNPADNNLTISLNSSNFDAIDIEIYNLSGKMIFMKTYSTNSIQINTRDLPSGSYLVKLRDSNGGIIENRKFIKI